MLLGKRAENGKYQSLEGHIKDSLKVFFQYLEANINVLEHFCHKWSLDRDNFIRNMYTVIYLHDCGKAIKEFQQRILENKHSPDYPHSFHGIHVIIKLIANGINPFLPLYASRTPFIEICTIMAHHSQLHRGIYESVEKCSVDYNDEQLNELLNNMEDTYFELGFDKYVENYRIKKVSVNYGTTDKESIVRIVKSARDDVFGRSKDLETKCKDKAIFTYMVSLLKTCDIVSSQYFEKYSNIDNGEKFFDSVVNEKVVCGIKILRPEEILKGKSPYKYQEELIDESSNLILVAGCGRGKTEAAQIVANNMIRRGMANKIIFAMPTQVTGNAMAKRMAEVYGEENVGLYHGKSLINKIMELEGEEADYKEIKSENYESKNFMKPIGITTVDHILYSLIHAYNSADFACGNMQTSVIVFDEIHYYEKDTTEYIFEALKLLRVMKIPHILMSATLPEYIIRDIKGRYLYKEDTVGLGYKPFIMKRVEEYLVEKVEDEYQINTRFLEAVYDYYLKGLRQIIIVNTVEKAQRVYDAIKEFYAIDSKDIILFHGRFTVDDRKSKEGEIFDTKDRRPFILITTQIIEISIDVSCDIMHTELAPFDALAQRGGRLNRKGDYYIVNGHEQIMYVYNIENTRPYAKDKEDEKYRFLLDSWESIPESPISYDMVKDIVNKIYSSEKLMQTQYTNKWFFESSIFGNTPEDVRGKKVDEETGGYFETRSSDFKQIDIIPRSKVIDSTGFIEAARNMVKIPLYLRLQYPEAFYTQIIDNMEYIICKFRYTYEKGIEVGVEDDSGYFDF